jgi:hypothetical protein
MSNLVNALDLDHPDYSLPDLFKPQRIDIRYVALFSVWYIRTCLLVTSLAVRCTGILRGPIPSL